MGIQVIEVTLLHSPLKVHLDPSEGHKKLFACYGHWWRKVLTNFTTSEEWTWHLIELFVYFKARLIQSLLGIPATTIAKASKYTCLYKSVQVTIHSPSLLYSEEQTNTRIIAAFKDPLQLTECSIEGYD